MPDISLCVNKKCPLRNKCGRFLAKPSYTQTYSDFKYKNGNCYAFWPLETFPYVIRNFSIQTKKEG